MNRRARHFATAVVACLTLTHVGSASAQSAASRDECLNCNHSVRGAVVDRGDSVRNAVPPNTETARAETARTETDKAARSNARPLPFRISIDGVPVETNANDTPADIERRTDVALARADIQIRFDPLAVKPALNTWAWPNGAARGENVNFAAWSNYVGWLKRAEVRVFEARAAIDGKPLAVLPMGFDQPISWQIPQNAPNDLNFVLRVYDAAGQFDETAPKQLRVLAQRRGLPDQDSQAREALIGWGENARQIANIQVNGGTVTVNGRNVRAEQRVRAFGMPVPVGANGNFVARQVLPAGPHTVEVALIEPDGATAIFNRNLEVADDSWFYVAIADLTIGRDNTDGPARLVTGDDQHYENKTWIDGRGAFYLKGKIKGKYLLTASADTREGPLKDVFSNLADKDPRAVLRRIDPDRYYPVYGDDSSTVEDAPTQGKFYVRIERGDSHIMWGNFQTRWTGTELTQYSRSLYGANALWKSESTTGHGERRASVNVFVADPGSLQSREEFRGTGGTLYYLRHQDVTQGSERVWIEERDRDSGLVLARRELQPAQDYDINYIQGRVLLRSPLSSTADGSTLVRSGTLSGNHLYLVSTYEYTPTTGDLQDYAIGARAETWINDHVRLGVTSYRQGGNEQGQRLGGVDLTLRHDAGTWLRAEAARSKGTGAEEFDSLDGGFGFGRRNARGDEATALRLEGQMDLEEVFDEAEGNARAYWQKREAGFSGPGSLTGDSELEQYGARLTMPIDDRVGVELKADRRETDAQDASSLEGDVHVDLNQHWRASVGLRHDRRDTRTASASSLLSADGNRNDGIVRLRYRPDEIQVTPGADSAPGAWEGWVFAQQTISRSGTRRDNDRAGLGANWQATDRMRLDGEISGGDGGIGGRFGSDYQIDDRSNVYVNYTLETEDPDTGNRGRQGQLTTGNRYRASDQMSIYTETRGLHGADRQGLVHAFGVDLAPNDRWTWGLSFEDGTVSDDNSGDIDRRAAGVSVAYSFEDAKFSSRLEYREEDSNLNGKRRTWLTRNSAGYKVNPNWRALAKFDKAISNDSRGNFFDANFTELVLGAAWRPIDNNRFNALFKYTYFADTPPPSQVGANDVAADYAQRSHVLSADAIYELTPWLTIGGKYGLRIGELRVPKTGSQWFSSTAQLAILRADLHLVHEWDALIEARTLRASEAGDQRSGFLVGLYRHVGANMKVGAGYNFTDFSDDLTDLSYDSRGWFINLVGKF